MTQYDTLRVLTRAVDDHHEVAWRIWRTGGKLPSRGGIVRVKLHERWQHDRPALAELAALHYLLETAQVRDPKACGAALFIQCSFGAIRKALAKGALKSDGRGDTDKGHVALFARFLATKYFEARLEADKDDGFVKIEPKRGHECHEIVADLPPRPTLDTPIGPVGITRHALNRVVGRQTSRGDVVSLGLDEDDLRALPDGRWTTAWKYLERTLPLCERGRVGLDEHRRVVRKYGKDPVYLWHKDTCMVFVVAREPHGMELVTAMSDRYWEGRREYKLYGQVVRRVNVRIS